MEFKRPDGQGAQGDLAEPAHAAGTPVRIARVDELERMLADAAALAWGRTLADGEG